MSNQDMEVPVDPELAAHLRNTLTKVAMTVDELPARSQHPPRRRRLVRAVGLTTLAVPVLGFAYVHVDSEYIDRLPTEHALVHGQSGRDQYWLVPSFHKDVCGNPMPGVEMVSKRRTLLGTEWDTAAVSLDKLPDRNGCHTGKVRLGAPGQADLLATRLGHQNDPKSDWIIIGACHPQVRSVRITTPTEKPRTVATVPRTDEPNGPRYAAVTAPSSATQVKITLLDERGVPVPGGVRDFDLRGFPRD
jgi:hypothetical protein